MNYNLFLDDERVPKNVRWVKLPLVSWSIVRNYNDFTSFITKNGCPKIVSFDHDLADAHYLGKETVEKTGYDCAKWLVKYCMNKEILCPDYYVHSLNPIGKQNIIDYINSYNRTFKK